MFRAYNRTMRVTVKKTEHLWNPALTDPLSFDSETG